MRSSKMIKHAIMKSAEEAVRAASVLQEPHAIEFIQKAAEWIVECFRRKGKLLIAGNGGSLCDALHFAEELTGQFRKPRPALAAIALADPGHLTCVSNDIGFESVFSRGIEALGKPGDLFIAMTTSGNSLNLITAVQAARTCGLKSIAFLGKTGGKMTGLCDLEWIVSGFDFSDRIQEAHMAAIHILIEQVESDLFYAQQNINFWSMAH